eukprot:10307551-Alexandrium_andersonii.AAC.1
MGPRSLTWDHLDASTTDSLGMPALPPKGCIKQVGHSPASTTEARASAMPALNMQLHGLCLGA